MPELGEQELQLVAPVPVADHVELIHDNGRYQVEAAGLDEPIHTAAKGRGRWYIVGIR